jgi:hypothetical protein
MHFYRLGGFTSVVAVNGVISVITIPLLVKGAGLPAWGSIATGQAAGGIAAGVVAWGWGVIGPAEIASRDGAARWRFFKISVRARLLIAIPVVPAAAACSWLITAEPVLGAAMAGAVALSGLSASWFFVGAGDPRSLILFDAAPRALANIVGAVAVVAGASPLTYPAAVCLATFGSATWASLRILGTLGSTPGRVSRRDVAIALTRQSSPLAASLLASTYLTMPLISVAVLAPAATPAYALADRLLKLALTALTPVGQYTQSWVPTPGSDLHRRIRLAVQGVGLVAVISGLVFLFLGPLVATWLSAGELTLTSDVAAGLAVALAASVVTQTVGLACLVPLGQQRALLLATAVGAPISVGMQWGLIPAFGATAAASSVAAAEVAVLIVELLILNAALRRNGSTLPLRLKRRPRTDA